MLAIIMDSNREEIISVLEDNKEISKNLWYVDYAEQCVICGREKALFKTIKEKIVCLDCVERIKNF